ncbi:APC family permease [Aminipila luticellarii]|uniref:Amino acid permease n=1 Tax=Aminipila luticellarii TaxID=2507160 RepID=A0A410PTJ0_9FIRM|nr:amino acid permease [Aminipila luticellarii]QAT42224.1 amino acid permease [Aminipila luticellarii]
MSDIFRKMPIERILNERKEGPQLKRVYGAFELIMLGIGVIVGTGIFVITGVAAADYAGPALTISFIIAGFACACAALCYAELASMIPASGSSYTFCYVGLGEVFGWFVGWCLTLEYIVAMSAIATGWSAYITNLLSVVGIHLPSFLVAGPFSGGLVNLPAIIIVSAIAGLLILGAKESANVNNFLVIVKIGIVILFIVLGVRHVNVANFTPFMPYGWDGVFSGAAIVFFAYLGFDAIANAAEEVKDPAKDLPKGIIGSLIVVTVLYIAVTLVLTGMLPYLKYHDVAAPVAYALAQVGVNWGSALVSVGAVTGLTSGVLVTMYSSTRLIYAISRDGLLPTKFSKISEKASTPTSSTFLIWLLGCLITGFLPIGIIAELVNMGTIAAFIMVSITVIKLRQSHPEIERSFRVPLVPVVPILAVVICGFLALQLASITKIAFVCWVALGLIIYFSYGKQHSLLGKELNAKTSIEDKRSV